MPIQIREPRVRPFLRWAGGKSWFINEFHDLLRKHEFTNYYEPFLGGGSIFFSIEVQDAVATLSDANHELIETYQAVRDTPQEVIQFFAQYENTEDFYYNLRATLPDTPAERAARFIYLNHTCYNGLYRVNRGGRFNVPYGRKANVVINEETILAASAALENTVLLAGDFENRADVIQPGTLVFLDPPYTVSHNNNGFISYNQNIFSLDDQHRLADYIHFIADHGAFFILTNAAHQAIRDIFNGCGHLIEVERQSLIGGRQARRGMTQEFVFTNIRE